MYKRCIDHTCTPQNNDTNVAKFNLNDANSYYHKIQINYKVVQRKRISINYDV